MSTFKSHFSLILALSALLAAFQFFFTFAGMMEEYEETLGKEYALVAIATEELKQETLRKTVPTFAGMETIDPGFVTDLLKEDLSPANLALLKVSLPRFYRIKLNRYPSGEELERIQQSLKRIKAITHVESFAKTQNRIYRLLAFNKTQILIFALLIFAISFLLMIRQMEVWRYEHGDRMRIMAVFGAPLWMRSAVLYRLAFADSMLSTGIIGALFYYLAVNPLVIKFFESVGLAAFRYDPVNDTLRLLALALVVSLVSVWFVIFKADREDA